MLNKIKSNDVYAPKPELLFNKKPVHSTLYGGIVSILVKLVFYFYVGMQFKKFILGEGD